ncbi:hypothetical protein POM88_010388 [Heracleum sosnowskyi]|uniref:Aminotransferase-like plant mobile domain-containing protein n=1 Tax=Heracleum sosnowskyi TaxID=360622 RepID=A0AAD8IVX3_9APIA|nr:hypothetical protein POM88_010388 [Heracleum sosnowskyi]
MAYTIRSLYDELDENFQRHLNESEDSRCLLNLLRFPAADLMPCLVSYFLKFYDKKDNVFDFNGIKLCISLEDVLFLTGLPIDGEAVISSESRDRDGFNRVFQLPSEKTKSNKVLRSIAKNVSLDDDTRKKVVLLLTITCFIVPSSNSGRVATTYLRYIEDLGRVDSFAWGAALLARLYHAIAECQKGDEGEGQRTVKKTLDGNSWVILSFFILRIPKLREALSLYLKLPINLNVEQLHVPFMPQIVEQLQKMSHNHRAYFEAFKGVLDDIFLNISHNDVEWTPYANSDHPQKKFGTRIGPIICNNFVVHHRPDIASGQFPVFEKYDLASLNWQPHKIEFKKNCGPCEQDFKKHYEKEVDWWNAKKLAEELMKEKTPNDNEEGRSRSPICTPSSSRICSPTPYDNMKEKTPNDNEEGRPMSPICTLSSSRICSPTPYDNKEDSPATAEFQWNRNEESNNITDPMTNPMRLNVLNSLNPDTFVDADVIILYIRYLKRTVSS